MRRSPSPTRATSSSDKGEKEHIVQNGSAAARDLRHRSSWEPSPRLTILEMPEQQNYLTLESIPSFHRRDLCPPAARPRPTLSIRHKLYLIRSY